MTAISRSTSAKVGDILRVPYRAVTKNGLPTYLALTRGAHKKPANHHKGICFYEQFQEPGQEFARFPAFIFYSNPYKRGAELTRGWTLSRAG